LKCDVIINATNFWKQGVVGCADSSRYVALHAVLAGARVDNQNGANVNLPDSSGQAGVTVDGAKSFFKWKTTFEDTGNTPVATYNVNAQLMPVNTTVTVPNETKDVRTAIFSFLSPKSHTNVFFWDPQVGVDQSVDNAASGIQVASALLVALLLLSILF
jgi:hypothetical protein